MSKPETTDTRVCTCHPSESPEPCQRRYALSECLAAANQSTETIIRKAHEIDPWAWTSHAFGTSDRELYLALKARRDASVVAAKKELQNVR
jgi:hypothetical protein